MCIRGAEGRIQKTEDRRQEVGIFVYKKSTPLFEGRSVYS